MTSKHLPAPGHRLCDSACGQATSAKSACTCVCGGRQHGAWNITSMPTATTRDPFAGMPVTDDEEW